MFKYLKKFCIISLITLSLSCSASNNTEPSILYGADDTIGESAEGVSGNLPIGSILKTTTNVNFRKGPGTSYSIIRVLSEGTEVITVEQTQPSNKFYKVQQQGTIGWVHGAYLEIVSSQVNINDAGPISVDRAEIIARAKSSVNYSYWWGNARWKNDGTDLGSCSGSCPNCSHSGLYGADCSGMVAKAWIVPASNNDITVNKHPYSTIDFNVDKNEWYSVSRSLLQPGDALVYNSNGSGHIVIYELGDGWGTLRVYECRGCSYGCVNDLRSLSSSYHVIRKVGL